MDASLERAFVPAATQPQRFWVASSSDELPWIQHASSLARSGHLQALALVISLIWTSFRLLNRRYAKRELPKHGASGIKWPWEICALACRATALVFLSLAVARGQTHWLNAACVVYAFVFGLCRLINDLEWRHVALHQVNFIMTVTLLLQAAVAVLPCIQAQESCHVSPLVRGALASLLATVLVALVTPREWVPPSLTNHTPKHAALLEDDPAPEEVCSWADYFMTYNWLTPMIWKGCRMQVVVDDLPRLAWYDDPLLLLSNIKRARAKGKTTFWTVLWLVRKEVGIMACCIAAAYSAELIAPFALYQLLSYLADPAGAVIRPWVWLAFMFCGPLTRSVFFQQYVFTSTRLIVRVKSSMTQELYHRAVSSMELEDEIFIAPAAKSADGKAGKGKTQSSSSAGRLANLMAADVDAIFGARDIVMITVGVPTGIAISLTGMYRILGWPALVGAVVLLTASPLSVFIAQKMAAATRTVRRAQDSRISLVSEYLSSIRAVKYFAWEDAVTEKISEARAIEQRQMWRVSVLYVCLTQVTNLIPFIALLLIFTLHVAVLKQRLTAATAFTTVFLVKSIRKNITQAGSLSKNVTAAAVAIRRLDRYFDSTVPLKKYPQGPLFIQDATFKRTRTATFGLRNISINFVEHGLNVISGQSGSGKTTLLLSILGETDFKSGTVTRPRDVAFASQTAWLQNGTIRDNILFHSPFEDARYERVLDACCLPFDLKQFDDGDQTVVGENGASLSGGQKARVALARALYSKAPLLLLDDIFSALDAKTSALLWERCFCTDMLVGRTTVLAAQQPWVAAQADLSVVLDNGSVAEVTPNIDVRRQPVVTPTEMALEENTGEVELEAGSDAMNDPNKTARNGKDGGDIVSQEMKASGKSGRLMFFKYMTYFGGPMYAILCLAVLVLTNVAWLGGSLWLSVWVEAYSKQDAVDIAFYLGVYAIFAIGESVGWAAIILTFENGAWHAARKLHRDFINAVLRVPLSWYKTVPVGRVVNRFSRDMYSIDTTVCNQLQRFLDNSMTIFFRIGAISSILPIFILPAGVTCFVGVVVGEMYTRTAVTIKKLVSSAQSPVFTQFSDTLAGLAVIRARDGMPEVFGEDLAHRLRVWSRAAEANYNCNRWVAVRVDAITALVGLCAGIIAVSKAGVVAAGLVGFSLTNATGLSSTILALVRSMNDLEVELQSFVRVREYAALEPEEKAGQIRPGESEYADDETRAIPRNWPSSGKVEFRNVTIRYDPDGPDILSDINLTFRAGERVAIVGRTGSGKSTLVLSLLRFTHIVSGRILYDDVDITEVSRLRLREGLTIIPQEAVLFSGTVGSNLDPTGSTGEDQLEKVLRSCKGIASFQQKLDGHTNGAANGHGHAAAAAATAASSSPVPTDGGISLATSVSAKGENFSHGQRQVLSLCRALVRRSPLMLLDEATASMDYETDRGIQEALRRELDEERGGRTLVTIAHRLRTIIDYDKVVVMGSGKVVEAGSPRDLYAKKGVFYDMVYHSGEAEELQEILDA